jgi:hypothetical protein
MQEELITFETAKLAKEKEFNILINSYYFEDTEFKENSLTGTSGYYGEEYEFNLSEFNENWNDKWLTKKSGDRCFGCSKERGYLETFSAPTQSLLQKWLREVHQLYVEVQVDQTTYPKFHFEVTRFEGNPKDLSEREWGWESKYHAEYLYRTYEEALETGLQVALKLIEIVKEK